MAVGPPFTWNDTCGFIASKWSPVIAPEPGIEDPPVWQVVIMPCARAAATSGVYSNAVLKAPKPAFASHTPFFAISPRSLPLSVGSRMIEPA